MRMVPWAVGGEPVRTPDTFGVLEEVNAQSIAMEEKAGMVRACQQKR